MLIIEYGSNYCNYNYNHCDYFNIINTEATSHNNTATTESAGSVDFISVEQQQQQQLRQKQKTEENSEKDNNNEIKTEEKDKGRHT